MAKVSQGGFVSVSWENPEGWIVESTRFHRPNVVICKFVSGDQQTPLIRAYLPPSTLNNLPDLEESLNCFPGRDPVVLGDINVDIGLLINPQDQQVTYFLASFGLVDRLAHFQKRLRYCNLHTWWKVRQGRILQYWCDYVLGLDIMMFEMRGI